MHRLSSVFVLGYHGCDSETAEKLIAGEPFRISRNDYDWLGAGVYFWETNPKRGLEFARELMRRSGSSIRSPSVVGAVVDLGFCLDLLSTRGIEAVKASHTELMRKLEIAEVDPPVNRLGSDLLLRHLDCAVINNLHDIREQDDEEPFDTVRGAFLEGAPIYENSGFREKTHIQICVRNLECIRAVFRVPPEQLA